MAGGKHVPLMVSMISNPLSISKLSLTLSLPLSLSLSLSTGGGSIESEGSEVRMMEGFTRSLPSSPLLNLRLAKRTGRDDYLSVY